MFTKPNTYTESIQVDAAGISEKVMKEGLPMEISAGVTEIREKSAESIVIGDTSHNKKYGGLTNR